MEKSKALDVWTLQHYSSVLLNGVLSRHHKSSEREWMRWCRVTLSLSSSSSEFARCRSPDRKTSQKFREAGKRITSLLLNAVCFFLLSCWCICVSHQLTCDPNTRRKFLQDAAARLTSIRQDQRGRLWSDTRSSSSSLVLPFSPSSTLKGKFNTAGEVLSCQEAHEDVNTSFITVW